MRALLVACIVAIGLTVTGAGPFNRERAYGCELYREPVVRVPYTLLTIDHSHLKGKEWALTAIRACSNRLAPSLRRCLGIEGYDDALRDRERFGMPAYHFRGETFLERAKDLAKAEAGVNGVLGECLTHEPAMARLSVMRTGVVHFSRAFEIAPGLQAFSNIDEMRVRSFPVSSLLSPARHGDRIPDPARYETVGYFESGTSFQIVVPVTSDGEYVADLNGTFYLNDECTGAKGQ